MVEGSRIVLYMFFLKGIFRGVWKLSEEEREVGFGGI